MASKDNRVNSKNNTTSTSKSNNAFKNIVDILVCLICMETPKNAHICPKCSQIFCLNCITRWFNEGRYHCPHCNLPSSAGSLVKCRWLEDVSSNLESLKTDDTNKNNLTVNSNFSNPMGSTHVPKAPGRNNLSNSTGTNNLSNSNDSTNPFSKTEVYVGNLNYLTNEESLRQVFNLCGVIKRVNIKKEKGKSKGYGFVEFTTAEGAKNAIELMNGILVMSRPIKVNFSKGKPTRQQETNRKCQTTNENSVSSSSTNNINLNTRSVSIHPVFNSTVNRETGPLAPPRRYSQTTSNLEIRTTTPVTTTRSSLNSSIRYNRITGSTIGNNYPTTVKTISVTTNSSTSGGNLSSPRVSSNTSTIYGQNTGSTSSTSGCNLSSPRVSSNTSTIYGQNTRSTSSTSGCNLSSPRVSSNTSTIYGQNTRSTSSTSGGNLSSPRVSSNTSTIYGQNARSTSSYMNHSFTVPSHTTRTTSSSEDFWNNTYSSYTYRTTYNSAPRRIINEPSPLLPQESSSCNIL